jgi:phage-related protein
MAQSSQRKEPPQKPGRFRLPHSRSLGESLFELRPRGKSGIGRAFYCFLVGKRVVIVHAFVKKTQQTPDKDLKLARKRAKELLNG